MLAQSVANLSLRDAHIPSSIRLLKHHSVTQLSFLFADASLSYVFCDFDDPSFRHVEEGGLIVPSPIDDSLSNIWVCMLNFLWRVVLLLPFKMEDRLLELSKDDGEVFVDK